MVLFQQKQSCAHITGIIAPDNKHWPLLAPCARQPKSPKLQRQHCVDIEPWRLSQIVINRVPTNRLQLSGYLGAQCRNSHATLLAWKRWYAVLAVILTRNTIAEGL